MIIIFGCQGRNCEEGIHKPFVSNVLQKRFFFFKTDEKIVVCSKILQIIKKK